jgi:peptidoglycan L-alanyl-D-glutamate endopeptidase CwlK
VTFNLSMRSLQKLNGVHRDLVNVVEKAIHLTTVDFGVLQGLRTQEEQKRLFKEGKTQTMNSRHMSGHAVDVVAYEKGKVIWDSWSYVPIAQAFLEASKQLRVPIRWGGCWAVLDGEKTAKQLLEEYKDECRREGKRPFFDFGHMELPKAEYP